MPLDPKLLLSLDRPREVRWTMLCSARLGRLAEPPPLSDLAHRNPHRAFYALCAYLWAAVDDPQGDFAQPEHLANYLETPAAQAEAFSLLLQALRQSGVLKPEKKTETTTPAAPAGSSGSSGPTPSSNSGPRARPLKA